MLSCTWKELQLFTAGLQQLTAACSKIARVNIKVGERLDCSHWFYSKYRREQFRTDFELILVGSVLKRNCRGSTAFSAIEGNFPSLHTLFSLLAGGFSLTFAGLILWYVCNLSFLSLLLLLAMVSLQPCLLQSNSSFPLRLSESQGTFNLSQIRENSEAIKYNLKASLPSSTRGSVLW